jgi:transcriptional regulator with XRE-family HTH domain
VESPNYGVYLRRARIEAADRLVRPELREVKDAADYLGITRGYLYKLENGEKKPSFEMLELMAERYGVLIGDLLPNSALRGPVADRLTAQVLGLPDVMRDMFMRQVEGFAASINAGYDSIRAEFHVSHAVENGISSRSSSYTRAQSSQVVPTNEEKRPRVALGVDLGEQGATESANAPTLPRRNGAVPPPIPSKRR